MEGIYNGQAYKNEQGDWVCHGNGQVLFTKGPGDDWKESTYEGDFAHHQRHGFGTLSWGDGESYEG